MDSNGDFSSYIVQEVAASLTDDRVPDRYIHKNGYTPAKEAIAGDLLIDFSRLSDEDELRKLRFALSTLGCFQVVNHGVEKELMEKFLEVSKQFFVLPLEEKKRWYGEAGMFTGYGTDDAFWGNQPRNWNDRLYLPADLGFLPDNPPDLSKTVRELIDKLQTMPETILKAMAQSLDLQEDCFLKTHGLDGDFTVKVSLYPQCPDPDHVLGLLPHTDGTTFTMVFQDHAGLEVMTNDRWFKVPVIPGAFFVNVGDLMEIMSNGVVKSTMHRVTTNSEKERFSVAMFYSPSTFKEVGPVEELVTLDRPQLYKKTSIFKYGQVYRECNPKGMRALSAFRL